MKKLITSLGLILILSSFGFSQGIPQRTRTYGFQSATTSPAKDLAGLGYGDYKIKWEVQNGTLSACTVNLQGSSDSVNWPNTIIANQTCTSDGESVVTLAGTASSYVRINVSAFTASFGTPVLNVSVSAWNEVVGASASNPIYATISGTVTSTLCSTGTCSSIVVSNPNPTQGAAVSSAISSGYVASVVAKASAGNLYGLFGYNSKSSAQWIQCANNATLPADNTVTPLITFSVGATSNFSMTTGQFPMFFSTGIVCYNSSAGPTKTIGSADTWFDILYN